MNKKIDEKTSVIIALCSIVGSLLLGILGCVILRLNEMHVDIYEQPPAASEVGYESYIDNIESDGKYVLIRGWALMKEEEILEAETYVVLKGADTGKYYVIPSAIEIRPDVSDIVDPGYDNSRCGFKGKAKLTKIGKESNYTIFIWYHSNDKNVLIAPNNDEQIFVFN